MERNNYYNQRDIANIRKINKLLEELPPFCEDFFRAMETRSSVLTREKYAYDLRIFFFYITERHIRKKKITELSLDDLNAITDIDIENYLSFLSLYEYNGKVLRCDERAKARKLASVRSMFKYFYNKNLIDENVTAKVPTPKLHEKEIIRLDAEEVGDIIRVAETGDGLSRHAEIYNEKTRVRDSAILTLFLGTGIRISELVGLNDDSLNFSDNSFVVRRKGGNYAILYFSDEVAAALKEYLEQKKNDKKIPSSEKALFLSLQYKRLSVRAVENLVKKYSKVVTPLKHITPHKLRSTYGTALYKETGDIYIVADVLGHKDVNTTRKHYAAITEDNRKKVAGKVKLRKDGDDDK